MQPKADARAGGLTFPLEFPLRAETLAAAADAVWEAVDDGMPGPGVLSDYHVMEAALAAICAAAGLKLSETERVRLTCDADRLRP